jgi:hypothetical protein
MPTRGRCAEHAASGGGAPPPPLFGLCGPRGALPQATQRGLGGFSPSLVVVGCSPGKIIVHPLQYAVRVVNNSENDRWIEARARFMQRHDEDSHGSDARANSFKAVRRLSDLEQSVPHSVSSGDAPGEDVASGYYCVHDTALDNWLRELHRQQRVDFLHERQVYIDGFLLSASCSDKRLQRVIVLHPESTLQYKTLPDLSRLLSALVEIRQQETFLAHLIQQLSPLRRRMRVRRQRALQPLCEVEGSVCLSLVQALLFGLYPRSCKLPVYSARRELACGIYHLRVGGLATQQKFLCAIPSLMRLALLEYMLNIRADFCPVEHKFLCSSSQSVEAYDHACVVACDSLRQTCLQSTEWSWAQLEANASQLLERVTRVCRIPRPTQVPKISVSPSATEIASALDEHVVFARGHGTREEAILHRVHSCMTLRSLPRNIIEQLATSIMQNHSNCMLTMHSLCVKHLCVSCLLQGGMHALQRSLKMRLQTTSGELICASCNTSKTVLSVNVFGKLLCVNGQVLFCCVNCAMFQSYNPAQPLQCVRCTGNASKTVSLRQSRKRSCVWCGRTCMARPLALLHTRSAQIVYAALCFKHTPPQHMIQFIYDTDSLLRYLLDAMRRQRPRRGR